MTDQSGREAPLASLSARQAKAMGLMTSGTCGPRGITLSRMESDVMCLSLASKLRLKQGGLGSILYRLTWKHWITPAGRLIPALRASAHRSSGSDCIGSQQGASGWPRPTTRDHKDGSPSNEAGVPINALLGRTVWLTGWPRPTVGNGSGGQMPPDGTTAEGQTPDGTTAERQTPDGTTAERQTPDGRKVTVALPYVTQLSGWPRPAAWDQANDPNWEERRAKIKEERNNGNGFGKNLALAAMITGGPRPHAGNPGTETYNPAGNTDSSRKTQAIAMTVEYRFIPSIIGEMPNGSCAVIPTERVSGPLNPAHSLWLMVGPFATAWQRCAERVTLSTSRKRSASSKR